MGEGKVDNVLIISDKMNLPIKKNSENKEVFPIILRRMNSGNMTSPSSPTIAFGCGTSLVWFIVAIPALLFMTGIETATLDKSGTLSNDAHNVTLTPSDWVGERFPLLPFLNENVAQRIESGHQTVILFRFDCEECKTFINSLAGKERYIFVAMPSDNEKRFSLEQYMTLPSDRE